MKEIHYNIKISGRVQGVGFRQSAKSEARFIGIKGWVKNMSNGEVYIEAEGTKDQLELFLNWCRTGSKYGYVDRVEFEQSEFKYFSGFSIDF